MINKIINRYITSKHYWRHVGFDELSELYTSVLLRSLSLHLIGIFVPVYLFQIGYSLQSIFSFFLFFFIFRLFADFCSAFIVAHIGPKHTIALSTLVRIVDVVLLLTIKEHGWPLWLLALVSTIGFALFFTAYHTEFSKIKHSRHAGKEIGSVAMLERIGAIAGPLVGGVVASVWGAHIVMVVAVVILLGSLIPLLMSGEVVRTKQKITFRKFRFRRHLRTYVAGSGLALDTTASLMAWPLLVGTVIFTSSAFAKLGVVTALSTITALLSIHGIGKLIDAKKAGVLFYYSVLINAFIHLLRPFVSTVAGVFATNAVNDPVTIAYRMSFMKAYYDAADNEPGYRIVFLTIFEMMTTFIKIGYWLTLWVLSFYFDSATVLQWSFIIIGPITLLLLSNKMPSLRRGVQ